MPQFGERGQVEGMADTKSPRQEGTWCGYKLPESQCSWNGISERVELPKMKLGSWRVSLLLCAGTNRQVCSSYV